MNYLDNKALLTMYKQDKVGEGKYINNYRIGIQQKEIGNERGDIQENDNYKGEQSPLFMNKNSNEGRKSITEKRCVHNTALDFLKLILK